MDNCYQCEKLISDHIEGKLDPSSRQQFENHLKVCSTCTKKTNDIKVLHNTLNSLPDKHVSTDFNSMLRARIRIENKLEKRKRENLLFSWKIRVPIYGVSVVLIIFILMMVFSQLSNTNTFLPVASMNSEYAAVNQNVSPGSYTVYSLERKSAIDVLSQQQSRYVREKTRSGSVRSDSMSLAIYEKPRRNLPGTFYQTSF